VKKLISTLMICVPFIATTASATCSGTDTCVDTPDTELTSSFGITLESLGATAGIGEVSWSGDDGIGAVEKMSELSLNTNLDYNGDACGLDCGDGHLSFSGLASERILTEGVAVGQSADGTVSVGNASLAQTLLNFEVSTEEAENSEE
jgi:hypothetical protein